MNNTTQQMKENIKPATTKQINYLVKLGASDDQLKDIDIISASKLIKELVKKTNKLVKSINKTNSLQNEEALKDYFKTIDLCESHEGLDMNSYYKKECSNVYKNKYGQFVVFEKPRIETRFCFGHGFCGVSTEEETKDAQNMAEVARTNQDYFISENLKKYDELLKDFTELLKVNPETLSAYFIHYPDNSFIHGYCANVQIIQPCRIELESWKYEKAVLNRLSIEEVKQHIDYLQNERAKFLKRLNTYLKRYGLSKINSWTYLVD